MKHLLMMIIILYSQFSTHLQLPYLPIDHFAWTVWYFSIIISKSIMFLYCNIPLKKHILIINHLIEMFLYCNILIFIIDFFLLPDRWLFLFFKTFLSGGIFFTRMLTIIFFATYSLIPNNYFINQILLFFFENKSW